MLEPSGIVGLLRAGLTYAIFGLVVPGAALGLLLSHYTVAYRANADALASPQTSFAPGGAPRPLPQELGPGHGQTEAYPDGCAATIFVSDDPPTAVLDGYERRVGSHVAKSGAFGSYQQRDLSFSDGSAARALAIGGIIFLFTAPNEDTLDACVARTPALASATERGIGNKVLDGYFKPVVAALGAWLLGWTIAFIVAVVRVVRPPPPVIEVPTSLRF